MRVTYRHEDGSFWVECTPEESRDSVEPRMRSDDQETIDRMRRSSYGWPHRVRGTAYCCFMISPDLSRIQAFWWHYPFHQLWNGYSPFHAIEPVDIESLDELLAIKTVRAK
jgi:hypothetical protein